MVADVAVQGEERHLAQVAPVVHTDYRDGFVAGSSAPWEQMKAALGAANDCKMVCENDGRMLPLQAGAMDSREWGHSEHRKLTVGNLSGRTMVRDLPCGPERVADVARADVASSWLVRPEAVDQANCPGET